MELYYRIDSKSWIPKPVQMTVVKGSGGFYWSFDFADVAKPGQQVDVLVAAIRGKDDQFPDPDPKNPKRAPYSWAIWPQYYKHPAKSPQMFRGQPVYPYTFLMQSDTMKTIE
jgi:hypothetical protein